MAEKNTENPKTDKNENIISKRTKENDPITKARNILLNGGTEFPPEKELESLNQKPALAYEENLKEKPLPVTIGKDDPVADFIKSFGTAGDSPYKAYDWVINVPSDLLAKMSSGDADTTLRGTIHPESETAYVFPGTGFGQQVGRLREADDTRLPGRPDNTMAGDSIVIDRTPDGQLHPFVLLSQGTVRPARIREYDTTVNLFSRNSGLLESNVMLDKTAVLIGCGSVGSFVAMELARSGVGRFVLIDTDTLEVHNICRHQCGFDDLGRYKVDAIRDKILNINPLAEVVTFRKPVERVPYDQLSPYLGRNTVIVGGGDNRASADAGCKLACKTDSSFVATCCWNRAFAGEVFYWQSGHGLSCYECALGGLIDSERPEAHSHYFGDDEDATKTSFEPGVAVDIDFVTIIATKLILDLLNRDNPDYTPRVINYLRQYTWICNTNEPAIGGDRALMFSNPLQVTTTLSVNKNAGCEWCDEGSHIDG